MTALGFHKVSHILEVRRAWEECGECGGSGKEGKRGTKEYGFPCPSCHGPDGLYCKQHAKMKEGK